MTTVGKMNDAFTILIVDDDPLVRSAVNRILTRAGYVTETAADGFDALNLLHRKAPDLMLLDLDMPGLSGLELLHILARDDIQPYTVILTAKPSLDTALEAGRLNVVDYFVKPFGADMIDQIQDILLHKHVPSKCMSVEDRIVRILKGKGLGERAVSTVVNLYATGGTNREIGENLSISPSTVRGHIRQAMSVFKVGSRTELVTEIIQEFSKN